ncbi:hypothetical protein GJ744_011055 [Endocarpon pusillum]|uniref:L-ornithine N(5)-oxygenase n=1 Tax=Endocarpon pusillum TaxID=364733 RepID=A0A8H7AH58_9EURO|nr:hypothetical protein GJ744_011055 [Endocarpon pusillum]
MARSLPSSTGTVIIGNGPAALILSYILHGNIPCYTSSPPHPDPLLHKKLVESSNLLHLDIRRLTQHFEASPFSYSTQALPVNVLLDTLIRPNGDTCDLEEATNIAWEYQPEQAAPHIVIGNTTSPGGQWVDNPVQASWDIGTLSYAGMLSLPGYPFAEHYRRTTGKELPPYTRPSRRQVTDYFRHYPHQVLIDDAVYCGEAISGITRTADGFHIKSHDISCKHLVLASGVFSELIPAPPLLQPLLRLPGPSIQPNSPDIPLLVVGSGFSAADVISSSPPDQKIIHIYRWTPSTSPSPLKACHQQAYPEYAGLYRRMKQAAKIASKPLGLESPRPKVQRASTSTFDSSRDWSSKYEGLPNTTITDVKVEGETALITLQAADGGPTLQRRISRLEYVVGRRGSLRYLSRDLRREILGSNHNSSRDSADPEPTEQMLSGQTLREKVLEDIEVAPDVFAIGSLTGDSLIRFAHGSCTYAAGKIMSPSRRHCKGENVEQPQMANGVAKIDHEDSGPRLSRVVSSANNATVVPAAKIMSGLDGHHRPLHQCQQSEYSRRASR